MSNGENKIIQLWDTCSREIFKPLIYASIKNMDAIVLVYDVCNEQTFDDLSEWTTNISKHNVNNIPIIIVGNKCDSSARIVQKSIWSNVC